MEEGSGGAANLTSSKNIQRLRDRQQFQNAVQRYLTEFRGRSDEYAFYGGHAHRRKAGGGALPGCSDRGFIFEDVVRKDIGRRWYDEKGIT